jgi:hypothetical protein
MFDMTQKISLFSSARPIGEHLAQALLKVAHGLSHHQYTE